MPQVHRSFTMLEMVMVLLIIALMTAAAVGTFAPEPDKTAEEMSLLFREFALSSRRLAISEGKELMISWESDERLFICGDRTLSVPDNLEIYSGREESDEENGDTDSVPVAVFRPDGSIADTAPLRISDGSVTARLRCSPVMRILKFSIEEKDDTGEIIVISGGDDEDSGEDIVPLWTDKERDETQL